MTPVATALLNLAWTAAIFVPLERVWGGSRREVWRGRTTDLLFYFGQVFLWLPLSAWILHGLARPLRSLMEQSTLPALVASLPWLAQVLLLVVLGDLLAYWGHRLQHAWGPLWRLHAVHHTAREVDWLAAYREHPLDGLYTQALVNLPAVLLGIDLTTLMGLTVFRGAWAIFVHSDAPLPLGPIKWLLGSPEFHRAHHAPDSRHHYANLAPYLDVLFGTHGPRGDPPAFGVNEPHPDTWWGLLVWGLGVRHAHPPIRRARSTHA